VKDANWTNPACAEYRAADLRRFADAEDSEFSHLSKLFLSVEGTLP
jgi:hypothetical protein